MTKRDLCELLSKSAAYVAKGVEKGAYKDTAGGTMAAERLVARASDAVRACHRRRR